MKINIDVNTAQEHYLKQYAALQFRGSIENMSTRNPIHFLQQQAQCYTNIPLYSAESEDNVIFEYDKYCDGCPEVFYSIEDIVKSYLDISSDEEIEEYNKTEDTAFVSYDDSGVYSYVDYLDMYGISESNITTYIYDDAWDTMAVSFSRKELNSMRESLNNHIYRPTRIYSQAGASYERTNMEYEAMMEMLMSVGETLLKEDMNNIHFRTDKILSEDEYMLTEAVEETATIAEYTLCRSFSLSNQYDEVGKMRVICVPTQVYNYPDRKKIFFKRYLETEMVSAETGEIVTKRVRYPFECDTTFAALRNEKNYGCVDIPNVYYLYFYSQYVDEIKEV